MSILVTGGAGYIGSHMTRALMEAGRDVVVLDNLSTGFAQAAVDSPLIIGDIRNTDMLVELMHIHGVEAVVHFAASSQVGQSMIAPELYYDNNVAGTLSLLKAMRKSGVELLVFSSSAAVYGVPDQLPIREDHEKRPSSVYGQTKWMCEQMLMQYKRAYGLRTIALRYFNAAGASLDGRIGEAHQPESHLIPNVLQAALGAREAVEVCGTDYDTPDGTCIRDYIHVVDLISAHQLALSALEGGHGGGAYNLGNGKGYSILQVLDAARRVTGLPIPTKNGLRRPGDPPVLVADGARAKDELGWAPVHREIEEIIESAWRWHRVHPNGYDQ